MSLNLFHPEYQLFEKSNLLQIDLQILINFIFQLMRFSNGTPFKIVFCNYSRRKRFCYRFKKKLKNKRLSGDIFAYTLVK